MEDVLRACNTPKSQAVNRGRDGKQGGGCVSEYSDLSYSSNLPSTKNFCSLVGSFSTVIIETGILF
jgi:hypothetical protein